MKEVMEEDIEEQQSKRKEGPRVITSNVPVLDQRESAEPKSMFICQICAKETEATDILADVLCKRNHSVRVDSKTNTQMNAKFTCSLCDSFTEDKDGFREHVFNHIKQGEICYCAVCQEWLNKLEADFSDEVYIPKTDMKEKDKIDEASNLLFFSVTSKPKRHCHNFLNFIYKAVQKKETTNSRLIKAMSANPRRTCHLCGAANAIKKLKSGKPCCDSCLKHEVEKTKHNWSLRYLRLILKPRHTDHYVKRSEDVLLAKHVCKLCGAFTTDVSPLINVLLKEEHQITSNNASIRQCLVCGFKTKACYPARKHILSHFNSDEVYYCFECQKAINEISVVKVPDSGITDILADRNAPALIGIASLTGIKSSLLDVTVFPSCGKCGRIFDYVIPLIHKLVDFRFQIFGSTESEAKKVSFYYCRLCAAKQGNKDSIEKHALDHIVNGDVYCRVCQDKNETKDSDKVEESNDLPSLKGGTVTQKIPVKGYSYEDAKIYESFLMTLDSSDFEGDEDLHEAIKSCDWSFVST